MCEILSLTGFDNKQMKAQLLILFISLLFVATSFAETKEADLAGAWYPASGPELTEMLDGFLEKSETEEIDGEIIGLISPHAGYVYAGPVAAFGFKLMSGKDIKTAVIIGFNHSIYHEGIAICDFDSFKTPLGEVAIDKDLTNESIAQHEEIRI